MPHRRRTAAALAGDAELGRLLPLPDGSGLRRLLREHGSTVERGLQLRFGKMLTDNEIEEVMSVAIYRAWRSAHGYEPAKGGVGEWFFVIAKRAVAEVMRRRQRGDHVVTDAELDRLPEPERLIPRPQPSFLEALRECVASLPGKQRRIIEADLRCGDVADASELAAELATSKESIYVLRCVARKTLRKALVARGCAPLASPGDEDES